MTEEEMYRVVIAGKGPGASHVASSPMTKAEAEAGWPNLTETFAKDLADGIAVAGIYTEADYRATYPDATGTE